jgi:hypothetical protein
MNDEFEYSMFTVYLFAEPSTDQDDSNRFKVQVVIKRTTDGKIFSAFDRYVAGLTARLSFEDALMYGRREAIAAIDSDFAIR